MSFGRSCGKGTLQTPHAHLATSQPDVGTQSAPVGYLGVKLVSRATYISRKKRNRETIWRQSKAFKRVQREAKRKLVAQLEISHEAVETFFFKEPGSSYGRENYLVSYTSTTSLLCYMATRTCFSVHRYLAQTRNFLVPYTSATISPCCMGTRTCFLHIVWCRQRWWRFEATEVSVRRLWRIPPESETQT